MSYTVLVKDLKTEGITLGPTFSEEKLARFWAEMQMVIYEELRAYKVVASRDIPLQ